MQTTCITTTDVFPFICNAGAFINIGAELIAPRTIPAAWLYIIQMITETTMKEKVFQFVSFGCFLVIEEGM